EYEIDVAEVAEVWRRGSVVGSWLVDLTADALARSPQLDDFGGRVSDSGEGRWTVLAAVDTGVPAPVITAALIERFESRGRGQFTFAVSGGHSPWAMFAELVYENMPWEQTVIYQVDERVAPDGDPDRNLTHLRESLGAAPARVEPMPVNDPDLAGAAAAYAK